MEDKTRKFIAVGIIFSILIGIGLTLIFAANTLQTADELVAIANLSLKDDPNNEQLKLHYNEAVKHYLGATTFFPGNLLGMCLGYPQNKWDLLEESLGYTWGRRGEPLDEGFHLLGEDPKFGPNTILDRRGNATP